jgi:hypothetical protein
MPTQPLSLVNNITAIAKLETHEDAIMIAAQDKIACLDGMSLEGDIPNNILGYHGALREISLYGELQTNYNTSKSRN